MTSEMGDKSVKVVYIMGSGRSGSTLLDLTLGSLPGFVSTGELANFFTRLNPADEYCSCGQKIHDCEFWMQVQANWGGLHDDTRKRYAVLQGRYERLRAWPRLITAGVRTDSDFRWYAERTAALFRAVAKVSGAAVLVDSSKSPTRALALSMMPGVDLTIVHLVRDPRGVAWSLNRAYAADHAAGIQHAIKPMPVVSATWSWMLNNWFADRVRRRTGKAILMRYEDFVQEPPVVLAQVLEAVGIRDKNVEPGKLISALAPGNLHLPAGNRLRRQDQVSIKLDDAWMRDMPAGKIRSVRLLAWPLMAKYGYASFQKAPEDT